MSNGPLIKGIRGFSFLSGVSCRFRQPKIRFRNSALFPPSLIFKGIFFPRHQIHAALQDFSSLDFSPRLVSLPLFQFLMNLLRQVRQGFRIGIRVPDEENVSGSPPSRQMAGLGIVGCLLCRDGILKDLHPVLRVDPLLIEIVGGGKKAVFRSVFIGCIPLGHRFSPAISRQMKGHPVSRLNPAPVVALKGVSPKKVDFVFCFVEPGIGNAAEIVIVGLPGSGSPLGQLQPLFPGLDFEKLHVPGDPGIIAVLILIVADIDMGALAPAVPDKADGGPFQVIGGRTHRGLKGQRSHFPGPAIGQPDAGILTRIEIAVQIGLNKEDPAGMVHVHRLNIRTISRRPVQLV